MTQERSDPRPLESCSHLDAKNQHASSAIRKRGEGPHNRTWQRQISLVLKALSLGPSEQILNIRDPVIYSANPATKTCRVRTGFVPIGHRCTTASTAQGPSLPAPQHALTSGNAVGRLGLEQHLRTKGAAEVSNRCAKRILIDLSLMGRVKSLGHEGLG